MRRIFTLFNLFVVAVAFFAGTLIMKYEDKYGVLTVAERRIYKDEEKLQPILPDGQGKININTATSEELQSISGIGESLAERIIDYREANGEFLLPEDVMKVSGIGKSIYSDISEFICVN